MVDFTLRSFRIDAPHRVDVVAPRIESLFLEPALFDANLHMIADSDVAMFRWKFSFL